jgi:hypothetical protein
VALAAYMWPWAAPGQEFDGGQASIVSQRLVEANHKPPWPGTVAWRIKCTVTVTPELSALSP